MFFVTYEGLKKTFSTVLPDPQHAPMVHMMSASGGEIVSLLFNTMFTALFV
jgi:solute carrier family 25 S-adenosylmethionine transporter 26